ncbi:MAG: superoxide dismutase [Bacteroidia bacterium]|uniref:Superoxide dismutase [Fe] n=1 Tax=bioreactor metagenome TaxID=1076179 RepID=A0A645AXM7_9ZZZZ|nr:superoxide dismutase [Rikenellaceae bacterium]NCB19161.1 superoxide dismutase [Bacteroidia bacterium]
MNFQLPVLPYAKDALEPVIGMGTIEYHHGKHHLAYVNNLNNLIKGTAFEQMSLEEIILKSEGAIFNNAAQVWNHTFYFYSFKQGGGGVPKGGLAKAIENQWGSFEHFVKEFNAAALSLFGSGWAWLAKESNGNLVILKESNAGTPLTKGMTPILTFDVWEHAYYLDYQNRRGDYLSSLWGIIDWDAVSARY